MTIALVLALAVRQYACKAAIPELDFILCAPLPQMSLCRQVSQFLS
jgi:hypothetical protein